MHTDPDFSSRRRRLLCGTLAASVLRMFAAERVCNQLLEALDDL